MVIDVVEACGYLYAICSLLNMLSHLPNKRRAIQNRGIMLLY